MNTLTSIRSFLKHDFGTFLGNFEGFYYKDLLALVQGIVSKKYSSISSMSKDALTDSSHTTFTRFQTSMLLFGQNLKMRYQRKPLEILKASLCS